MPLVEKIIEDIIRAEGHQYTNHPNDRGGPTKFGITLATLRSHLNDPSLGADDVQALTIETARRIYFDRYVVTPGFVHVLAISEVVGIEVIDSGVNCGQQRAARWLQRALNAFNRSYRNPPDYAEITEDGRIGPKTLSTLSDFFAVRGKMNGEKVLVRALNSLQGAHYLALGTNNPTQEQFMFGWFANRVA